MPKRRKIEVHRLTISGLPAETGYGVFLKERRDSREALQELVHEAGTKSHVLYRADLLNSRLRLQFMSYSTGFRPDVFDTNTFAVQANPLPESMTGVEWTHCLGGHKGDRYLLLIEKVQAGIWPKTVAQYLQWLVDETYEPPEEGDPVVVNLEAVAGEAFARRVAHLERIKRATYRQVRPNPGWADLENDLAEQSGESDATKTDVTMIARSRGTLAKNGGIVRAILDRLRDNTLDYARIVGERDGIEDKFDTARMVESKIMSLETDDFGQVHHADAWTKLATLFDELD